MSRVDIVENNFSRNQRCVYIAGDLHGALSFKALEEKLGENDCVVLVGDVLDRGADTFKILQTISQDERFVAVRGNHEDMFLDYMKVRRKRENEGEDVLSEEERQAYDIFLLNGGDWAQKQTLNELLDIENYIYKLPYIRKITLPSNKEFIVCHADMSFLSDEELNKRLREGPTLSSEEINYVIWARSKGDVVYGESKRNEKSIPVYCGHEITTGKNISVVRKDTNHINLDFGAYSGVPLVGVEHPGKAMVFGEFDAIYTVGSGDHDNLSSSDKQYFLTKRNKYFDQLFYLHKHMGAIEFTDQSTHEAYYAYLRSKDFSFVDRNCANMNFSDADLTGADFSGADFSGAKLTGAKLTGAVFDQHSKIDKDQLNKVTCKFVRYAKYDNENKLVDIVIYKTSDILPKGLDLEALDKIPADDFQQRFKDALKNSAAYQAADDNEKNKLLDIANKIIVEVVVENKNKNKHKEEIITSAAQRVWVLAFQQYGTNDSSFLNACVNSKPEFDNKLKEMQHFASEITAEMDRWKYHLGFGEKKYPPSISKEGIPDALKNRFLTTSLQVEKNATEKNPTDHQALTFLIDRLDRKLAEYNIRVNQQYKTGSKRDGETHQKMHKAKWMREYLSAMREAVFKGKPRESESLADFLSSIIANKKQRGVPPRPSHTFGSELVAIHDDLNRFVRKATQTALDKTREERNKKQEAFNEKNAPSEFGTTMPAGHETRVKAAIAKLELTLEILKQREIEYARRVAVDQSHSGIFSMGISARDKLVATRNLIKACNDAFERDVKGEITGLKKEIIINFSSERIKAAGTQQSFFPRWREHLGDQYQDIFAAAKDADVKVKTTVPPASNNRNNFINNATQRSRSSSAKSNLLESKKNEPHS